MALSSNSSVDEIIAAYVDNALYDLDGSTAQCRLFIQACRFLLIMRPESISIAGVSQKFVVSEIQNQLKRAETWMASNSTRGRRGMVRQVDISNIRNR